MQPQRYIPCKMHTWNRNKFHQQYISVFTFINSRLHRFSLTLQWNNRIMQALNKSNIINYLEPRVQRSWIPWINTDSGCALTTLSSTKGYYSFGNGSRTYVNCGTVQHTCIVANRMQCVNRPHLPCKDMHSVLRTDFRHSIHTQYNQRTSQTT